jgi:hypothetical protein
MKSKHCHEGSVRFFRHGGIYRSDIIPHPTHPGGNAGAPPAGRPCTRRVGRGIGHRALSSSAMSSGRLILDQVARQQSLSPLHRQSDHTTVGKWVKIVCIERRTVQIPVVSKTFAVQFIPMVGATGLEPVTSCV